MRSTRHPERPVFGYAIVRVETSDAEGELLSRCYEVSRSPGAHALAREQSLRAARRWIVMQELREFRRRRQARAERPGSGAAAAT